MDPLDSLNIKKDSTLALIEAAARRGWTVHVAQPERLFWDQGRAAGVWHPISLNLTEQAWYRLGEAETLDLGSFDAILMRKDPPFDMSYIYATYFLDHAAAAGTIVANRPDSLRNCNEKFFATQFPHCLAPTLVTADADHLRAFAGEQGDLVMKPLDGMGGMSVFRLLKGDPNLGVVIETLTRDGTIPIMAQRYLPEIREGDKRILLLDGEPVPYALARLPKAGEARGNLAAGGRGEGRELTERDRWLCAQVGPELANRGLRFVGLDVIGDYITEINVTCPTCIRELDAWFGIDIGAMFFERLEASLTAPSTT